MLFERIQIDIRKLRDYCLNPNHPVGKHKARVFSSQLGVGRNDAKLLKEIILKEMKYVELEWGHKDEYGQRCTADLELNMKSGYAHVKTIWILKTDSNVLELVTCYIIT